MNLSSARRNAIINAKDKTRFQEDVNRLSIQDVLVVYRTATPAQRKEIDDVVSKKAYRALEREEDEAKKVQLQQYLDRLGIVVTPPEKNRSRKQPKSFADRFLGAP